MSAERPKPLYSDGNSNEEIKNDVVFDTFDYFIGFR